MAEYKISQTPNKPPTNPKLKGFWAPTVQQKKLRKKTLIIGLSVAGGIILLGIIVAGIKLHNDNSLEHNPPPVIHGGTKAEKTTGSVYAVTAAAFKAVTDAVNAKDATMLNSYYASQVHIVIVNSLISETVDGSKAGDIINGGLTSADTPWDFHVPADELAGWQMGPYGQYFTGIDVVGISADGDVISIGFDTDGNIDSVFIAPSDILDAPTTPDSGSSDTTTTPDSTLPVDTNPAD